MAVCVREPLAPVTVIVVICAVANMQESVAVPAPVMLPGVTVQATLFAERFTTPLNPLSAVTVMVETPEDPAFTLTLVGLAVRVKSRTVNVAVALWVMVPLFPVIVRV